MDGARKVGFERGAVGEFHGGSDGEAVREPGEVVADVGFEQAGDLALEGADVGEDALDLVWRDLRLEAEVEGMDDHGGQYSSPILRGAGALVTYGDGRH